MSSEPTRTEQTASGVQVSILLLASGFCALMMQVVWMREMRLIFGATTAASAAVLAVFMAGLGIGGAYWGRLLDLSKHPLRLYGRLELGVAISAACSPALILLTQKLYLAAGGQTTLTAAGAFLIRMLSAIAVLGLPTFLMGGTLPAAARAVTDLGDKQRRNIGLIYGWNTLGAVLGAAFSNFYLLEMLGNLQLLWLGCVVNLLVALSALKFAQQLSAEIAIEEEATTEPSVKQPATRRALRKAGKKSKNNSASQNRIEISEPYEFTPSPPGLIYLAAGLTGFVFFLMEIVWYRMLGPLLGGTTYTFGLILCVALLGIGLGGMAYHGLSRRLKVSPKLFAITCAGEAMCIALPLWLGDRLALWVLHQNQMEVTSFSQQIWIWFQAAVVVILPSAVIAGFQFPLLIAILGQGSQRVAAQVGKVYAANTLGSIAGSLAGGFYLLPLISAPGVWRMVVWVLICLAAVMTWQHYRERLWQTAVVLGCGAAALWCSLQLGPTAVWRHSGIGAGRAARIEPGHNAAQNYVHARRRQTIWETDGVESSIAITATDSLSFIVNGKGDGNAIEDAGTQIGLGILGPLLHKSPSNGLIIGLGTGETAGWLAAAETINTVDVVELEPAVLEMVERCRSVNRDVMNNPKVAVHLNDAREFLLTSSREYDLIISEPSNPYRAGIASLYTQEFYEAVHQRLPQDGLFLQWLQGYEVDNRTVRIVLRTLQSVFPHVEIWRTRSRDMLLVCSPAETPAGYPLTQIQNRISEPALREALQLSWRVADVEGVLSHYVCGPETINQFLNNEAAELNTDNRNLLEYAFAKTVGQSTRFSIQELQDTAIELKDDLPLLQLPEAIANQPSDSGLTVNRNRLERRRQSLHAYLGEEVPISQVLTPEQVQLSHAFNAYRSNRFQEALAVFQTIGPDMSCPIESTVYAHLLAENNQEPPAELNANLALLTPADAQAIETIRLWKQGNAPAATENLLLTLETLRTDAWATPKIFERLFYAGAELGDLQPETAGRLYKQTQSPFAMYRFEERRLLWRYVLAERLDPETTTEALASFEPNVPWIGWMLENRAEIYDRTGHDLAESAKEDVALFNAWEIE